jgi:hypothetical protein
MTTGTESIDAFAQLPDGSLLISTTGAFSVQTTYAKPGSGSGSKITGDGGDLLQFVPQTLGDSTSGTWSRYFDGSDVGLKGATGNIDALAVLPDGNFVVSTAGRASLAGLSPAAQGADLLRFSPVSLGDATTGAWSYYFQGSQVGLTATGENIDAVHVLNAESGLPTLLLSTEGNFSVAGAAGFKEDVLAFTFTSAPGVPTLGVFAADLALDGSLFGLAGYNVRAYHLGTSSSSQSASSRDATLASLTQRVEPVDDDLVLYLATQRPREAVQELGILQATDASPALDERPAGQGSLVSPAIPANVALSGSQTSSLRLTPSRKTGENDLLEDKEDGIASILPVEAMPQLF